MRSIFIDACYRKKTPYVPIWMMRQAGRSQAGYRRLRKKYTMLSLVKSPDLASRITLEPVRTLGVDAAILFSDIIIPLVASGVKVDIKEGIGPVFRRRITSGRDFKVLKELDTERGLEFMGDTIIRAKAELGNVPLIGFAGAPFTLASYLIEGGPSKRFERVKAFMYGRQADWKILMNKLARSVISYLKFQIENGVDAVQLFDSWAGILSPSDYIKYVLPYSKEIFSAIGMYRVPRIHFGTQTGGFLKSFSSVEAEVTGIDWRVNMSDARKIIGKKKAIQGNLDPAVLKTDRKIIKHEVDRIFNEVGSTRGFIFNVGHGVLPDTPVSNLKYLVEYVHSK